MSISIIQTDLDKLVYQNNFKYCIKDLEISKDQKFIWLLTGDQSKTQIHIINIDLWSTARVYKEKNLYSRIHV